MNVIIIENPLIKKEIHLNSDKITGWSLTNVANGRKFTSLDKGEEFVLTFKNLFKNIVIKSSDLKVNNVDSVCESELKKYIISFESFNIKDNKICVKLIYLVNESRCYLRKYIEIHYEEKGSKDAVLESISFEDFKFNDELNSWSIPKQQDAETKSFPLSLGQPVYVDSFYFGCEFPVAINKIEHSNAKSTYYSGKKISELIGSDGYISHKSVIGGADSDIYEDVQKSFFDYIKDISKPVYLRRQYNSWYDNMLNITRENVTSSFLEIEKQMTKTGEPALDSYVADDGWNDYSGEFWDFNKNFPDELYPFKNLAENLGSKFGLWLGPRGGYTNDTIKFARRIQKAGNGFVNKQAKDICVGSEKYTRKTTELLLDFEKRFNINYFKLDGFAQRACKNKKHDHMTGGYNDIYFFTDTWERWIDSFEKFASAGSTDFWINLTCYAWPSAWFLQWVNSVWMQISFDVGFIGKKGEVSDKDRMLSYRDELYCDFSRIRQFQFPQRALYNHDPIYGKEAKVSMTDDEFREYLFTMATRGTQFWELYYSHSMMNDAKWRINYSCMRFIEENITTLANSVVIGGRPSKSEIYGFSCFGDDEGIVSLRNSANTEQSYTLKLDELVGVKKSFTAGEMYTVIPYDVSCSKGTYSYGDSVSFTLAPYQTVIVHFGKKNKELCPVYCKAVSDRELFVTFNQFVNIDDAFSADNSIVGKTLLEDYISAVFTFEKPFEKENMIKISSLMGATGIVSDVKLVFRHYENYVITDGSVKGKGDFTVEINLSGKLKGSIYKQGDELEIAISDDNFVIFKVGSFVLKSVTSAEAITKISAVREKNNVIKLYLDKKLDAGMCTVGIDLLGEKADVAENAVVKLIDKALAYDEV
ncbi:MAG: hypothetical protein IJB74_01905 [Clostridia bacterium]|nr:hypothetical protein [Clostridia bacterium]